MSESTKEAFKSCYGLTTTLPAATRALRKDNMDQTIQERVDMRDERNQLCSRWVCQTNDTRTARHHSLVCEREVLYESLGMRSGAARDGEMI